MITRKFGLLPLTFAAAFAIALPVSFDGGTLTSHDAWARSAENAAGEDYGCSGGRDDARYCGREDHHHPRPSSVNREHRRKLISSAAATLPRGFSFRGVFSRLRASG